MQASVVLSKYEEVLNLNSRRHILFYPYIIYINPCA